MAHKKTPVKGEKNYAKKKHIVFNSAMEYFLNGIMKTSHRHNENYSLNTVINFKSPCTQNV